MRSTLFCLVLLSRTAFAADVALTPPLVGGEVASEMAVDAAGNLYLIGTFQGSEDFNGALGFEDSRTATLTDVFVTRINVDGTYGWTQVISGPSNDSPAAVATDGTSVFVAVTTSSNAPTIGQPAAGGTNGFSSGFIAALDAATGGAKVGFATNGLARVDGTLLERVTLTSATVFGSTLFIGGRVNGSVQVNQSGPIVSLSGGRDGVIIALDTLTGQRLTSFSDDGIQFFGGSGAAALDSVEALAIDARTSSLYAAGTFAGTSAGISGATGIVGPSGTSDAFVLRLDLTGAPVLAFSGDGVQVLSGGGSDTATALAIVPNQLWVGGQSSSNSIGIGAPSGPGSGATNAFLAELSTASGAAVASFGVGGVAQISNLDSFTPGIVATLETVFWGVTAENGASTMSSDPTASYPGCPHTGQQEYVFALDATGKRKDVLGPNGFLHLCSTVQAAGSFAASMVAGHGALYLGGAVFSPIESVTSALDGIGPATPPGGQQAFVARVGANVGPAGEAGANGANGADGAAGANGTNGSNGTNGANGTNGSNGTSALITTIAEPAGTTCPAGGTKINAGNDKNNNGALDVEEITSTQTICNGAQGKGCSQTTVAPWLAFVVIVLFRRRDRKRC